MLAECLVEWGRVLLILVLLNWDRCFWFLLIFSFYYSIVQEMYVCVLKMPFVRFLNYWYGRKCIFFRGWYDDIMEEDLMAYSLFLCIRNKLRVRFSDVSVRYSCSKSTKFIPPLFLFCILSGCPSCGVISSPKDRMSALDIEWGCTRNTLEWW